MKSYQNSYRELGNQMKICGLTCSPKLILKLCQTWAVHILSYCFLVLFLSEDAIKIQKVLRSHQFNNISNLIFLGNKSKQHRDYTKPSNPAPLLPDIMLFLPSASKSPDDKVLCVSPDNTLCSEGQGPLTWESFTGRDTSWCSDSYREKNIPNF